VNFEFLLAAALISATPLTYAALGELVIERAGVVNLGVEGTMLIGAVAGFIGSQIMGSAWAGVLAALVCGALFGSGFAILTITARLDQIVAGLAFTILGHGLSSYMGADFVGVPPRAVIHKLDPGVLGHIPVLGPILFRQDPLVLGAILLPVLLSLYLYFTRMGLVLMALGEKPDVVDSLGLSVTLLRYVYVIGGSALMGLGGAYLSLADTPSWVENITAGRGWIAIALVIFGTWRPLWVFAGAVLFGLVDAGRFRMQLGNYPVDPHFINMLPYLATLLVLALVARSRARGRLGGPTALGAAYDRERR